MGVLVLDSKRSGNMSTDIVWIHLDTTFCIVIHLWRLKIRMYRGLIN